MKKQTKQPILVRDNVETLNAAFVAARRARLSSENALRNARAAFEKAENTAKKAQKAEKEAADAFGRALKDGE